MNVLSLRKSVTINLPQCQYMCKSNYLSSDDFVRCSMKAAVSIDNSNYCKQHGGMIALDKLINQGDEGEK